MQLIFNPFAGLKPWYCLLFSFALCSVQLVGQTCAPPQNFETTYYDHSRAEYQWAFSEDALSYSLSIEINKHAYIKIDLAGSATTAEVKFSPLLKHNDHVHALLTKNCVGGGENSTAFDFVIIDDIIVYLTGSTQAGELRLVEPVTTILDNLIPSSNLCGLCDADFFRLESGFYAPYGIAVDPTIGPIEQLRFLKSELCGCLDNAISSGILNENGGPGQQYNGTPLICRITPYAFDRQDCPKRTEERNTFQEGTLLNTLHVQAVPNPVAHFAQIRYRLPMESDALLTIHDVTGRLVQTVLNYVHSPAGDYQVEFDARTLAPGFYYGRLQAAGQSQTVVLVVAR